MEKSDNSRDEYSQRTPRTQQGLRRALLDSKAENKQLAAENAALKKQIASKELIWEQEKKKLLAETDSLVSTLFMASNDTDNLVKALESARANQKEFDAERKQMERKVEKKEEEVCALKESLHCQQMETEKVKESWKAEVNEMKCSFDKSVIQFNAEWERRWTVRQTTLQQDCEKKVSQLIQKKDDVITGCRKTTKTLIEGNLVKLKKIEEIRQSETEWQTKHKALEDHLRCELAAKEESFKTAKELQKQSREVEEKWLAKEEEWLNKASKMEEEMKLLSRQNAELQELALKTDKEKAKMKKEEKKVKKETEKRLKKERKEEERQEKVKKENEKKQNEKMKREKEENEKREKKERKKIEKKERKKREE